MSNSVYIVLIPFLILITFVLLCIWGRLYFGAASGIIGTAALLISTLLSLYVGYNYFFVEGLEGNTYKQITALKYTWLQFRPGLSIDMSIILDPISVMMIIVVTFVSL